jgi:hypothetical protein
VESGISPIGIRERFALRGYDTIQALQFFSDEHLHPELRAVVTPLRVAAFRLVDILQDGPQLSAALIRLVEAKDIFCRHYLITHNFKLGDENAA